MSIPGLNPFIPPAQDPPPVLPQILPPRPRSPRLRNRPGGQGDVGQEDASAERGLKRDRPAESDEDGMDIESSSEPALKRRRGEGAPPTPELLHRLIEAADADGVRMLIQQAPHLLNECDPQSIFQGLTPLMLAFQRGHLSVAQMLRQHGANLTAESIDGYNCLHLAADNGRDAVVAWLLREGLGVDAPTYSGNTPLMLACQRGHLSVAQMLLQHGANLTAKKIDGYNCLHLAADNGCEAVVDWLLREGLGIDAPTEDGKTPLMLACQRGHLRVAQMLLQHGTGLDNLNWRDHQIGDEIFTKATKHDQYDVLLQLISRGWSFPEGWDTLPTRDSSDDVDVAAMRTRIALIHDLDRVFREMAAPLGAATEDNFIDPAWLLPEKRSDRQLFIESYLNQFLATDEETSRQPISNFEISLHPLFSYVIHDQLTQNPKRFTKLLHALAGTGRVMSALHSQKALLFKLQAIQRAWQTNRPFQDKHLSPANLSIIDNVLKRQLETLLLATEAYFLKDMEKFPETLKRLCEKYIRIGGNFDAAGFTKALAKQGIYAVNADRLTELVKKVWKEVRLKPMDLPPMVTIGQVYSLSESQVIERLLPKLNKAVLQEPEEWILPGFATGLATLQQEDQGTYADQIFGRCDRCGRRWEW